MRGEGYQPVAQPRHLRIGSGTQISVGWHPDVAIHHLCDGIAQRLDAEPLGNEARGAEIQRPADRSDIVAGRNDHHRDRRILRAEIDQAGEAGYSWHGKIEQDQIDVRILLK